MRGGVVGVGVGDCRSEMGVPGAPPTVLRVLQSSLLGEKTSEAFLLTEVVMAVGAAASQRDAVCNLVMTQ